MKDFVYSGTTEIVYGAAQLPLIVSKIAALGKRILIVPTPSFVAGGHYEPFRAALEEAGLDIYCLHAGKEPLLSKVNEGILLCSKEQIDAVIGIGGGVSMDLAKSIALGALHTDVPFEKYLTYELSTEGLDHLPVVTVPTNPMSGSETNADVQITLDDSGMQVGCAVGQAVFTWLNPVYMLSLPNKVLIYGQMTAFVQLSINYLNLSRSVLAEHYAEASMKSILECLRTSLAEPENQEARGTLLLNSALSLSGLNDFGREPEFIPYPLQSFAQRYLGLNYTQALTGLFPYWIKAIYRASSDKSIFYRYFEEILHVSTARKTEEALLQEALQALQKLYREFGIAFSYGEMAEDPKEHQKLVDMIASFGPMPCHIMSVTPETLADIIEDSINTNLQ